MENGGQNATSLNVILCTILIILWTSRTLPRAYYLLHEERRSGVKAGQPYGEKYLYKWWVKACENLRIEGVDMYGGTRHSSAVALREHFSPEQIKQGTMHQTNKAFERYFRIESDDVRKIYKYSSNIDCNFAKTKTIK